MSFVLREARDEFRAGMRSGVVPLIYVLLTGYLLLVLSKADYLRDMGAVDIPRNAGSLVYLMTAGDSFFLFFAWAWVFAQPVLRDRAARLHEVVLAAPVPLRQLLAARYVGALGVALVIGSSQIAGFLLAPLLEWIGAVPPGSFAAPPWRAFAWASLVFTLPLAAGAGALYFIAAMKSRSVGGPFAVAAVLMTCWMVAIIVLKDGHVDQFFATVLDPSGFTETEWQVKEHWTPREKMTSLVALTPALLWNRLLWCGMPLLILASVVWRARREALVLERTPEVSARTVRSPRHLPASFQAPVGIAVAAWQQALWSETAWQTRSMFGRRGLWLAIALLFLVGMAAAFVHGIQNAYGPLVPRPELVTPLLKTNFYLIIVFIVAGLAGQAARRDEQPGLVEMFDAAPAPGYVRLVGRALATAALTTALALVPAASGIAVTALAAPWSLDVVSPLAYQLTTLVPALFEIAALTLLAHALIRRPGPAYAASMLAAFILVVNHEAELVTYPPFQIGLPVQIGWSGLTGLAAWAEKLAVSDGFKLSVAILLLALAAMLAQRGTDEGWRVRWRAFRSRLPGRAGGAALAASVALFAFAQVLHQRYVVEGGYETLEEKIAGDAAWEARWLAQQGALAVEGGSVELEVDAVRRLLIGRWRLSGVRATGNTLHAELPLGFQLSAVRVQGHEIRAEVKHDHLAAPLGDCPAVGCEVEIAWTLPAAGWDVEHRPSWLLESGFWLLASEVMPRLGFDADRVLRTPHERARFGLAAEVALPAWFAALPSGAVAPAGQWTWRVSVAGDSRSGATSGPLDFADARSAVLARSEYEGGDGGFAVLHDRSRQAVAALVAEDVASMRACVARRIGQAPAIETVAQWPRELGETSVSDRWLLLAEDPHWDVADKGTGRWVRRAEIATAMARRVVQDAADLRQGAGASWLSEGLPGAIGLLCVGEADGIAALEALLSRGADRVTQALAGSKVPVGPLALARTGGWAADYAPLAALDWVANQHPAQLEELLKNLRGSGDITQVLTRLAGKPATDLFLGPPNASDIRVASQRTMLTGERWRWSAGDWLPAGSTPQPWRLHATDGGLEIARGQDALLSRAGSGQANAILLDAWPSYERSPLDNAAGTGPR